MFTVTELGRRCSLSRGTLLYYESIGLLKPPTRTAGNYRAYGGKDLQRLDRICIYRKAGLKLADIRDLLDRPGGGASEVLKRRLKEIDVEFERSAPGEHQEFLEFLHIPTGEIRKIRDWSKQGAG
jgi:DNA-binding transcriptional MerR regulator